MHMAQLMPLPLNVSCFSKIQIGCTFLVLAHLGSPGKGSLNGCLFFVCTPATCFTCVCAFQKLPTHFPDAKKAHIFHDMDSSQ